MVDPSATRESVVSATLWLLYPQQRDPVPIFQEGGWTSEQVCMGPENLILSGVQTPNHSAHIKLLYQLHYPGCKQHVKFFNITCGGKYSNHLALRVKNHSNYPCAVCCYDRTHQISKQSKFIFKEFTHCSTKANILAYKESVSSVCSQQVTTAASHQLQLEIVRQPGAPERGPKRWQLLGPTQ
jgi:hypothetical protein